MQHTQVGSQLLHAAAPHAEVDGGWAGGATTEGQGRVLAGRRRQQQAGSAWTGNTVALGKDKRWGTALASCSTCHMQTNTANAGRASVESAGVKL